MKTSCPNRSDRWKQIRAREHSRREHAFIIAGIAAALFILSFACQGAEIASWYGESHRGHIMANGQPFDPDNLTAASWFYPLGTKVVVTHDDRSVVVEITDRGPAHRLVEAGRKIDLTRAAFAKLADPDEGLVDVTIRRE